MAIEESDLKPCPFCGGEAEYERQGSRRQSSIVHCVDCGCTVEANEEEWSSGMRWNRRTPDPKIAAMLLAVENEDVRLDDTPEMNGKLEALASALGIRELIMVGSETTKESILEILKEIAS